MHDETAQTLEASDSKLNLLAPATANTLHRSASDERSGDQEAERTRASVSVMARGSVRARGGARINDKGADASSAVGSRGTLAAKSVGVRYEGEVRKRGQVNPAFQRRYFVLPGDGTLKYYKSKKAFDMDTTAFAGSIACKGLVSHEPREQQASSASIFPFTLTDATGKQIECACDSLQQRTAWHRAILQVCATCQKRPTYVTKETY